AILRKVARDRPRRADLDATRAAGNPGAPVRADLLLVLEESWLLELPRHLREHAHRARQRGNIAAGGKITLRRLRCVEQGAIAEIEHEVESVAAASLRTGKIDRPHLTARRDAFPVRPALVEIDLVRIVDGLLGADANAGVAPRASFEIDRIDLLPFDLERTQPPGNRRDSARPDRVAPLCRQLRRAPTFLIG